MSGFVDPKLLSNPFDKLVSELSAALINANYRKQRLDHKKTIAILNKLARKHGQGTVKQTIEWYISQAGRPFCIEIKTLQQLEGKFPRILDKMKSVPSTTIPFVSIPQIHIGSTNPRPINQVAREMISQMGDPIWPGNEKDQELIFVESCLYEYHQFRQKLLKLEYDKSLDKESRTYRVVHHLRDTHDDVPTFVRSWVKLIHILAWNSSNWSGRLMDHLPTPNHWRFDAMFRDVVGSYCSDVQEWYKIRDLLKGIK